MNLFGNYKILVVVAVTILTMGGGLLFGKLKEKDYLDKMYQRRNFTLLDEKGDFFELKKFPESKLLLLIFTPDELLPAWVTDFTKFSSERRKLEKLGVKTVLVTRINREVARNFKFATRFDGSLLLDSSGTVGRLAGIWDDFQGANYWGYALVDNHFRVYWRAKERALPSYGFLVEELKKVSRGVVGE